VLADDARLARYQRRADRLWSWLNGGCHLTRGTKAAIATAGFEVVDCDRSSSRRAWSPDCRPPISSGAPEDPEPEASVRHGAQPLEPEWRVILRPRAPLRRRPPDWCAADYLPPPCRPRPCVASRARSTEGGKRHGVEDPGGVRARRRRTGEIGTRAGHRSCRDVEGQEGRAPLGVDQNAPVPNPIAQIPPKTRQ
jgi:hypothetical protein